MHCSDAHFRTSWRVQGPMNYVSPRARRNKEDVLVMFQFLVRPRERPPPPNDEPLWNSCGRKVVCSQEFHVRCACCLLWAQKNVGTDPRCLAFPRRYYLQFGPFWKIRRTVKQECRHQKKKSYNHLVCDTGTNRIKPTWIGPRHCGLTQ